MFPPKKQSNQAKSAKMAVKSGRTPMPPALAGKTLSSTPLPSSGGAMYSKGGLVTPNSAGCAKHYGK